MGTAKRERQKTNRALRQQQVEQSQTRRKLLRKVAIGVAAIAAIVLFVWISSTLVGGDDESPSTPDTIAPVVDLPGNTVAPNATTAPNDTTEG